MPLSLSPATLDCQNDDVSKRLRSANKSTMSAKLITDMHAVDPTGVVTYTEQGLYANQHAVPQLTGRVLRMRQVAFRIGVSRSTIYDWLNRRSKRFNPHFPRPFKLSQTARGAVGWHEWAIEAWIVSCGAQSGKSR